MKSKQHAEVYDRAADKAWTVSRTMAGDKAVQMEVLALFASIVAESYRESDNARG